MSDPVVYESVVWMLDTMLVEYTQKVTSPAASDLTDAMHKYLRNNGAIEAINGMRKRVDHYNRKASQ